MLQILLWMVSESIDDSVHAMQEPSNVGSLSDAYGGLQCLIWPRCLPFANFPGRLLGVALPFFRHPFIVFFYHWKHHTYILVAFNSRPRVQHTFSHDSRLESTHNALFNSWFFLSFDNEHNGFGSTRFKRKKSALDIRLAWLFGSRSLLELSQLILGLRIEIKWMHGLHEQASEEKSPSKISYH